MFVEFSKHTQSGITLRFIYTLCLMDQSLSELANNLQKEHLFTQKHFLLALKMNTRKMVDLSLNLSSLGSYSHLYLKIDVPLLCDTFKDFISFCIHNYGLGCAQYFFFILSYI